MKCRDNFYAGFYFSQKSLSTVKSYREIIDANVFPFKWCEIE